MEILTPRIINCQDRIKDALAASGPLTIPDLEREIIGQCPGIETENALTYLVLALSDLIRVRQIEQYAGLEAFDTVRQEDYEDPYSSQGHYHTSDGYTEMDPFCMPTLNADSDF
jgi:hypothetical protein